MRLGSRITLRSWRVLAILGPLAAACGDDDAITPLPITATVALAAGEHVLLRDTAVAGAVQFAAAGSAGAEYLVVGQLATGQADVMLDVRLGGQAALAAPRRSRLATAAQPATPRQRFHDLLRAREAAAALAAPSRGRDGLRAAPARGVPPTVGTHRTFRVCGNLDCDALVNVPATAAWVGSRAALYTDDANPAGGLSAGDLASLGAVFDTVLYPLDTLAFGRESDIDTNGVIVVLLTKQVNALVPRPQCDLSFVTGYFFGADLAPGLAAQYNNGEVFYGMVPDPAGSVACARSLTEVNRILPVTFVHEFQHMISFNQHVLVRGGLAETLWLNEGLSHLAEELGGLHYDSLNDATQSFRYLIGNLYNAALYLGDPARYAMITEETPGTLEGRGAEWLFVRYLADRFGAGATTRALVQTVHAGAANVEAVAGRSLADLLGEWALAAYVSDLPGFTPPPALTYSTWRFRATYASLHQQFPVDFRDAFPLIPASGTGADVAVTGPVASGSGHYLRITQPPGNAGFALTFRPASGGVVPADRGGQLAIVRTR